MKGESLVQESFSGVFKSFKKSFMAAAKIRKLGKSRRVLVALVIAASLVLMILVAWTSAYQQTRMSRNREVHNREVNNREVNNRDANNREVNNREAFSDDAPVVQPPPPVVQPPPPVVQPPPPVVQPPPPVVQPPPQVQQQQQQQQHKEYPQHMVITNNNNNYSTAPTRGSNGHKDDDTYYRNKTYIYGPGLGYNYGYNYGHNYVAPPLYSHADTPVVIYSDPYNRPRAPLSGYPMLDPYQLWSEQDLSTIKHLCYADGCFHNGPRNTDPGHGSENKYGHAYGSGQSTDDLREVLRRPTEHEPSGISKLPDGGLSVQWGVLDEPSGGSRSLWSLLWPFSMWSSRVERVYISFPKPFLEKPMFASVEMPSSSSSSTTARVVSSSASGMYIEFEPQPGVKWVALGRLT